LISFSEAADNISIYWTHIGDSLCSLNENVSTIALGKWRWFSSRAFWWNNTSISLY